MTTREQIEAASAKATQGVWTAERAVDMAGFETGKVWIIMKEAPCGYDFDRYEDAEFLTKLVNAYRAGKLLVIEDEADAVRRMAGAWNAYKANISGADSNMKAAEIGFSAGYTAALAALRGDKA